ncbi:hypothetical protein BAUCODRAFT_351168 [Baudoinia panamericana UAMH 10762]|uniref:Uncharacterized protein n=1 Tax=Baudoinia panamericana (strain UAMH 10762) TaxID=717646 RepID=M2N6S1_BAUPA|nr:uncharacterized protein BAUCODRAFT_351168 [Baudoinia panamericana UAMH 10762]EMC99793.1 hypothetical protein BAUCODRAFT_351168 [Baudoinia panamericana UAMH 10762]
MWATLASWICLFLWCCLLLLLVAAHAARPARPTRRQTDPATRGVERELRKRQDDYDRGRPEARSKGPRY